MTVILGISAFYHDSAAALLKDGDIIAAAQEERFTRKKHDSGFPTRAVEYCLAEAGLSLSDVDAIGFYEKPLIKFERLLETYLAEAPRGFSSFLSAMPLWLKEKLFQKRLLVKALKQIEPNLDAKTLGSKLLFGEHHQSHAASAFYPSPFTEAAVLTIDGVGEWNTTTLSYGQNNQLTMLQEINFPHSLGLLYSAFTYYTGFKVNSGEYKVMGLAPYGEPTYVDTIKQHLIDIKPDGSFRLNMDYFNYATGLTMTNEGFHRLFGAPPRQPEADLTQREMDLARSVQDVTEEVMLKLARSARKQTGSKNLCLAGGVALNCVANGKILAEGIFDNLWIQPAAGDAGGALGVAYTIYHQHFKQPRKAPEARCLDNMKGAYLGPKYDNDSVKAFLDKIGAVYHRVSSEAELYDKISEVMADEKVIGWHQGRMEFGPRALGARSILGDARSQKMQSIMNLKIKYRESFRPFAPAVLRERVHDYFELDVDSPYMLLVANVQPAIRKPMTPEQERLFGIDKLNIPRSSVPAITHVDYSARVQTIHPETNPRYYGLAKAFEAKTGCGVIVNTSFNVRGEPIVCTPEDSYRCFMRTEMDVLAVEDFVLYKHEQPAFADTGNWRQEFELD